MTQRPLIELLERLKANAEEHGRHRDVMALDEALGAVTGMMEANRAMLARLAKLKQSGGSTGHDE
jgi:hypothetical protein